MSKNFYNEQSDITAAKIKIYEKYITNYLPKILLTFKNCLIADLFCGAGKNGNKNGSPLVLLEQAKYILTNDIVKQRNPKINILFNDIEQDYINNLETHLKGFYHKSIIIHKPTCVDFKKILPDILSKFKNHTIPKFFFLDPFTYSNISIADLKELINLSNSEIFLFTPIFHSYRFASMDYAEGHQTRIFIDEFTTNGMADYNDINDFMQSIKQKLRQELKLNYVRPVLLDDGKCKNAIFLLTKHREGMLLMNKIVFQESDDGKGVNIKEQESGQGSLFGTEGTQKFSIFSKKLKQKLKNNGSMTNDEIVDFTIMEEFLPKNAKDALNSITDKIIVYDGNIDITSKQSKWNIAENITKEVIFTYVN